MKLGIMQPYAFPYLGYFQLINAVDQFVLYDDVPFSKQGWTNRNVLGARHGRQAFTLPICRPRLGQPISEVRLHAAAMHQRRLLRTISTLYGRAPAYDDVRPVLERAIVHDDTSLGGYIRHSLDVLNGYLNIATPIVRSSEQHGTLRSKGVRRVIDICRAEGADTYINAEGGMRLYDGANFRECGINLVFLVHEPRPYRQNGSEFLARLSIIDVMMFNSRLEIARLLGDYRLVDGGVGG